MVEATDKNNPSYLGDPGTKDEDGNHCTIGCTKDTTTCGGENTHFCETEEPSHKSDGAKDA